MTKRKFCKINKDQVVRCIRADNKVEASRKLKEVGGKLVEVK